MRLYILVRVATETESNFGAPVLAAAARAAQEHSSISLTKGVQNAWADPCRRRSFITGPVLLTDALQATAPLYMAVRVPDPPGSRLQRARERSGVLLVLASIKPAGWTALRLRGGPTPMRAAPKPAGGRQARKSAQVINAMGMSRGRRHLGPRRQAESRSAQVSRRTATSWLTPASPSSCALHAGWAILGYGAWLRLGGTLTGGMIIAALHRGEPCAASPSEGTIEG